MYAQQGYRIIAMGYKPLARKMTYAKVQRVSREKIECDLTFLGFVILENRLKPDTCEIINNLSDANIRTIMVTGDNILTALSVAHDCDMIPTGQSVIIVTAKQKPQIQSNNAAAEYELIYNLTGMLGNNNQINGGDGANCAAIVNNDEKIVMPVSLSAVKLQQLHNEQLRPKPNGFIVNERGNGIVAPLENGDGNHAVNTTTGYHVMTNSNSIASLETVDTCTQSTLITQRDVEQGALVKSQSQYTAYDDDVNELLVSADILMNNNIYFLATCTYLN